MTFEEYEELINEGISTPDKAPANFKTVLEAIKADLTNMQTLADKSIELEGRVRDLQDTNMRLFLAQTSKPAEDEEPEELEGEAALQDFISKLED